MVYITGDTHGRFDRIISFCQRMKLTEADALIILGDVGVNFYLNKTDRNNKRNLQNLGVKFFLLHGNHEVRPTNIEGYIEGEYWGGKVLYQPEYPNLMFPVDGEVYDIPTSKGDKKAIVINGAYSVDKYHRMARYMMYHPDQYPEELVQKLVNICNNYSKDASVLAEAEKLIVENDAMNKCGWWNDEQPNEQTKKHIEAVLESLGWNIDLILSHTCPYKYEPVEAFLPGLNQALVDSSTEEWLEEIEDKLTYERWYCGHYHIEKKIDKMQFMFNDFDEL